MSAGGTALTTLLQEGRHAEACHMLRHHLSLNALDVDALVLLGKLELHLQNTDAARDLFAKAAAHRPDDSEIAFAQGVVELAANAPEPAVGHFRTALSLNQGNAGAAYNLGFALRRLGRHAEAIEPLQLAGRLTADDGNAWFNLGNAFLALARHDDAQQAFLRAKSLMPDSVDVLVNLAEAQRAGGNRDEAETSLRQAHGLAPSVATFNGLGNLLANRGQVDEALEAYLEALALVPHDPDTAINLCFLMERTQRQEVAARIISDALAAHPEHPGLLNCQGLILASRSDFIGAKVAFEHAVALAPRDVLPLGNLGTLQASQGDAEGAANTFRHALSIDPYNAPIHSNLLFTLLHGHLVEDTELFQEHLRFGQRQEEIAQPIAHVRPHASNLDRRLRVGFVSPDFRAHAVSHFFAPVLERLNRAQLEVFLYSTAWIMDEVSMRLRASADHWCGIAGMAPDAAASLIANDGIDVLIDLAGHTALNGLPIFARKAAPIQMTWLGYPGTTGLRRMDYRLLGTPPSSKELAFSTETLVPDGIVVFEPPANAPDVSPPPVLRKGYPTLGSVSRAMKISPSAFGTWCKIMRDMPQCHLSMLLPAGDTREVKRAWAARFEAEGVDPARVDIQPERSFKEFLEFFAGIDLVLDPFPYSGGTTSMLSLWMGVPLIAMKGNDTASRTGGTLMEVLTFDDLVARDETSYVAAALDLLADRNRLQEIRATLRARMMLSHLMGVSRASTSLTKAITNAWRHYIMSPEKDTGGE